jgi:hypothetical protein
MQRSGLRAGGEYNQGWKYPLNPLAFAVDTRDMRNGMDKDTSHIPAPSVFCRSCASPLVQATDWEQEEGSQWGVRLWCPDCGFEQAAVLDRAQLLYLSLAVEEGFAWMLDALTQFTSTSLAPPDFDLAERVQTDRIGPAGR